MLDIGSWILDAGVGEDARYQIPDISLRME